MRSRPSTPALWLAALLWVASACLAARSDEPAGDVNVELLIRGPDGKPLVNTPVRWQGGAWHAPQDKRPKAELKTGADGWARHAWPIAHPRIVVIAPGIGYGATGTFDPQAGNTVQPELPALAPLGIVSGTLPAELRGPNVAVWLSNSGWLSTETLCDADGRFLLRDVPAGLQWLRAGTRGDAGDRERQAEIQVRIVPGEQLADVKFVMIEKRETPHKPQASPQRDERTEVWAEGTVRDEGGRPIPDVEVFARGEYHGGMRAYEMIYSARTDVQGRFQIVGESKLSPYQGYLLAYKIGHPYVVSELRGPKTPIAAKTDAEGDRPATPDPSKRQAAQSAQQYDLVLPAESCGLEVLVTMRGNPVADAAVSVAQDMSLPSFAYIHMGRGNRIDRERVERVLHPLASTNEQGIARFADLPAGTYTLSASDSGERGIIAASDFLRTGIGNASRRQGIVVTPGRPHTFHVELAPADDIAAEIEMRWPTGQPAAKVQANYEWSNFSGYSRRSGGAFDEHGRHRLALDRAGLWRISYEFFEPPATSIAWFHPIYRQSVVAAASPLLRGTPSLVLTAVKQQHDPGSILVQLQDAAGQPKRGNVFPGRFSDDRRTATTDEHGEVRFCGILEEGPPVTITADIPGLKWPILGERPDTWPADEALLGKVAFFPKDVQPETNTQVRVVMRPQPIGYVRGIVRPAPGTQLDCYRVHLDAAGPWGDQTVKFDTKTGRFLAGPYPVGKEILALTYWVSNNHSVKCLTREVTIDPSRVAEVVIDSPAPKFDEVAILDGPVLILIGNQAGATFSELRRAVEGRVQQPDRKTPAAGAEVALYLTGRVQPVAHGRADYRGQFTLQGATHYWQQAPDDASTPKQPTLVAWLPGKYAPLIFPIARPLAEDGPLLVLPRSLSLCGKVTVRGQAAASSAGAISVAAARQGDELFHTLFNQSCSADADGNFELPALAAGEYRVQAALDNIWLSPSKLVTVPDGACQLDPITLEIGEPGCATTATIVDHQGRPLPGIEMTLSRPSGPLADQLWPKKITADGAGVAQIPPLEAGEQTIQVAGQANRNTLHVSKLRTPHIPDKLILNMGPSQK